MIGHFIVASKDLQQSCIEDRNDMYFCQNVAAQVQAVQTRQLRDAVAWLRNSAKWPKESLPRCTYLKRQLQCCLCNSQVSLIVMLKSAVLWQWKHPAGNRLPHLNFV